VATKFPINVTQAIVSPGSPVGQAILSPAIRERGATAVQMLVILVPVAFGLIGFAVDLGMLYSAKSELQAAANAMALAAAQRLIGTDAATGAATLASQSTIESGSGFGNRYNFNANPVGQTTGSLTSVAPEPSFYAAVADASGGDRRQLGCAPVEFERLAHEVPPADAAVSPPAI